jgi:hypothetical protein
VSKHDPTVTSLVGRPISLTAAHRAQAAWLLRKYTSLTYLRRMAGLLASFVAGYEDLARFARSRAGFHRENLASFNAQCSLLAEGTYLLERGYTIGYASILQGCIFAEYIAGRRFEGAIENEEIGYLWNGSPQGLFAWAVMAMKMCLAVSRTLRARWAFPGILMPPFVMQPLPLEPASQSVAPAVPIIRTGEGVPTSGIWRPIDIPDGCPNYLWAGREAPAAERASERLDYPAPPEDGRVEATRTTFTYVQVATRWELLWQDGRYTGGRSPESDEAAFLGPETEPWVTVP